MRAGGAREVDGQGRTADREHDRDHRAVIEAIAEAVLSIGDRGDRPRDQRGRVGLHVAHVREQLGVLAGRRGHELGAQPVGRDLGREIGEVVVGPARGMRTHRERGADRTIGRWCSTQPSSTSAVENGGIEPGVNPPTSAW
jgi:hypothetical protein